MVTRGSRLTVHPTTTHHSPLTHHYDPTMDLLFGNGQATAAAEQKQTSSAAKAPASPA